MNPLKVNSSYHQHKSLFTLTQINLRTPEIFQSLFKTNIHTLLSFPIHQQMSWLAVTYSAHKYYQIIPNSMGNLIDTYPLLLIRIHSSRLIPYLTNFDQYPTLINVAGPENPEVCLIKENTTLLSNKILITNKT